MNAQVDLQETYRVEVSGWDASENFFVEKTILDWVSEERKEVILRSTLREGCVIFMRLMQSMSDTHTFPLAYQAVKVNPKDATGKARVSLAQLRPRATHRETALLAGGAAVRVA